MKSGTRLGPYEIQKQLGAGGMGEVYLAQDTRLGRRVAIKVLPEEYAGDPERLARFEQEARAAAGLNHPHIAAVFDVGEAAGSHFMVQEYLEGEDLHDALQAGPWSRERALTFAAQIADALAAAHAAGIVHRDLKPRNVFVSPGGHAKVLDFGLAKLVETAGAGGGGPSQTEESPTALGTVAGVIMGSAGYMAPEQAGGATVDHRVDLFACGCILYEMLVGRRAFEGETLIDTLHAVTRTHPAALDSDDPTLDPDVRWLLDKALAKDPAARYQSAADLAVDLRRLAAKEVRPSIEPTKTAPARPANRLLAAAAAMAALVVGLGAGAWYFESDAPVVRLSIPVDLPANLGSSYFTISPDGSTLAYRSEREGQAALFLRRLDGFEETRVLGSDDALGPAFSPDGTKLAFFAAGRFWSVDVAGGSPRQICDVATNNSFAYWGDDGYIYFVQYAAGTGLYRVPELGGEAEEVAALGADLTRPRPLPDGRGLSFGLDGVRPTRIYFFDGSPPISLARDHVTFLENGKALFVDAGDLYVADYDRASYAISGVPSRLETGVSSYELAAGTLVYRHFETTGEGTGAASGELGRLVRRSESGDVVSSIETKGVFEQAELSSDGTLLAAHRSSGQGGAVVWDVVRGTQRMIDSEAVYPHWGADSNTVYLQSSDGSGYSIDRITLDDAGPRESLITSSHSIWPTDVSNAGDLLLFYEIHPETERDIWTLPLDGSGEAQPFLVTNYSERSAVFSPDDRWVAYMSDASGRPEVYVRPLDRSLGGEVRVTVDGGREPRWNSDGTRLYFRLGDSLWYVPVTVGSSFEAGEPKRLYEVQMLFEEGGQNQQYDVFANGDVIYFERALPNQQIRVVTNWLREIENRSP